VVAQSDGIVAPPLVASERTEALPLSFAQQRLWFLDQLEPNTSFYNCPAIVRLRGPLNLAALERTFTEISRRHEVLRTRFVAVDGEARQQIAEPAPFKLLLIDLSTIADEFRNGEAQRLVRMEAATPFDLSAGELLRVKVLRLAAEEHLVLLTTHHIISDGWSMGVLIKEVDTLYQAYSEGRESSLEELAIQYGDFARWQREWLQGEVLEQQLGYWREQLADLPALELPTDRPRPAIQSYRGRHHYFTMPTELTQQLKELSQQEGATLFMVLLGAFQLLLSRYAKQEDVVVGTDIAGRNRAETENLIGFFINQLVLRTDLSGGPTFKELLKRVREVCLGAYAHQDVPFEKLVEELRPERIARRQPFFQVKFVLQNNNTTEVLATPELKFTQLVTDSQTAKLDLLFLMAEGPDLGGSVEYNTDIFDEATIKTMTGHFITLLQNIAEQPDVPIHDLNYISETEKEEQVLKDRKLIEANKQQLQRIKRKGVTLTPPPDLAPLIDTLVHLDAADRSSGGDLQ
ncbi:MAG TPA: condensation domain-containing protein, partial [Pyrinomonadaceae bacterium]|nr:condensation domain-containing protein [Pyrinomonadaceae bacterium]